VADDVDPVPVREWLSDFLDREPAASRRFAADPGYHFGVHVVVDVILAVDDRMRAAGFTRDTRVELLKETFELLFDHAERRRGQARSSLLRESGEVLSSALRDIGRARSLRRPAGTQAAACTSWGARWCPKHGMCTCPPVGGDPGRGRSYDGADCPLHSKGSSHPSTRKEQP